MWSMFALLPGIRRSWSTCTPAPTNPSRRRPKTSSPSAPAAQALVLCGSSPSARISPPKSGWFARILTSRRCLRRSYSRKADAPATPGATSRPAGVGAGRQRRHRSNLVSRSCQARVPTGISRSHARHRPGKRSEIRVLGPVASPFAVILVARPGSHGLHGETVSTDLRFERVTGIEPALPAWEAGVLPLNYTRVPLG